MTFQIRRRRQQLSGKDDLRQTDLAPKQSSGSSSADSEFHRLNEEGSGGGRDGGRGEVNTSLAPAPASSCDLRRRFGRKFDQENPVFGGNGGLTTRTHCHVDSSGVSVFSTVELL